MKNTSSKYNLLLNLLLFSGLGCFSYLFLVMYSDIPERYQAGLTTGRAFVAVIVVFNSLGLSLMYINRRIRNAYPALLKERRRIVLYTILIALLLLIMNYLLLASVKWGVKLPHPFLINHWSGLRMLLLIWLVELVIVSQIMINNFYRHLLLLHKRTTELEDSSAKAQYMALQNQLNPHFLFNSLNTLISEIEYNPQNATLFTRHLSDVYRYILQCQDQQLVTLRTELAFLDSYIFLHQVRLGNCITLSNEVDPFLLDGKVPPLTLQLLVENIIKHNSISMTRPMTINLIFDRNDSMLSVSNEVQPKKGVMPSGKGLQNLSARYRLLCNKEITVQNDHECFTVKVPLLYE